MKHYVWLNVDKFLPNILGLKFHFLFKIRSLSIKKDSFISDDSGTLCVQIRFDYAVGYYCNGKFVHIDC